MKKGGLYEGEKNTGFYLFHSFNSRNVCRLRIKDNKEIGGDGYGKASDDTSEHVEITLGGNNLTNSDSVEGWPTEVVEKLEKKFNVTLKTKQYDNESLNLDLSGGTTVSYTHLTLPTTERV